MDNPITKYHKEDFLWLSYFSVTKKDCITKDEKNSGYPKALQACISRAYLDLCRTLRFSISSSKLEKTKISDDLKRFKEAKCIFRNTMICYIKTGIENLMNQKTNCFDKWHKELCINSEGLLVFWKEGIKAAEKELNGDRNLFSKEPTLGQAQKWINMSLKNMLVMGLWDNAMSSFTSKMHVVIDSVIINAANEKFSIQLAADNGWSNISNYSAYLNFQMRIRNRCSMKNITPIEWEWDTWIDNSRKQNEIYRMLI